MGRFEMGVICRRVGARMRDEETSATFWRARAARLKRLTARGGSTGVERGAREGDEDDDDCSTRSTMSGDADVARASWALTTTAMTTGTARPSTWTPRACPTTMETSTSASSGSRWLASRGRRRGDADALDDALDDARSLDALRAGYKTLLREVTARHAREREAMEREMASLRDRVRALETAAESRDGGAARRRSPRREILAPRSPGDDAMGYELSPMSAADRTPPPMPREMSPEAASAGADEKENEDAASTPKAFRPPRPPSRQGSDADDSWVEAWERAEFSRGALPLNVRPGKGFVCPFTGAVVNRTP